jgi:hypothetical protein
MSAPGQRLFSLATEGFSNLTDAEITLVYAVSAGEVARYDQHPRPEAESRCSHPWDTSRTLRAQVIRWLRIDRNALRHIGPTGIRIEGANIDAAQS